MKAKWILSAGQAGALVFSVSRCFGVPVDQPPLTAMSGGGSIKSDEIKKDIYDDKDPPKQIATEWTTLTYTVDWKVVPANVTELWITERCANQCNGGHKKHSECDASCDTPCNKKHKKRAIVARYEPDTAVQDKMTADSARLAKEAAGSDVPLNWTSEYSNVLKECRNLDGKQILAGRNAHWAPICSWSVEEYGCAEYLIRVKANFKKHIRRLEMGRSTNRDEDGPSQPEQTVGRTWWPQRTPLTQKTRLACACEVEEKPIEDGGESDDSNPGTPQPRPAGPRRIPTGGSDLRLETMTGAWDPNNMEKMKVSATGIDLNQIHVSCENPLDDARVLVIPIGLLWTPTDSHCQRMVSIVPQRIMCPGHGVGMLDIRVMCVDIGKKEPDGAIVFHPSAANDDPLISIAEVCAGSRFRGPHDQARIWILMDQPTLEDINMRVAPGITPGMYVNVLSDVALVGGVDIFDPRFHHFCHPRLLVGGDARRDATEWYINVLAQSDADGLVKYLKDERMAFAPLFDEKADRSYLQHAADIARACCKHHDLRVRLAGLSFLTDTVPANRRMDIEQMGGLDLTGAALRSDDLAETEQAVAVVDVFAHKLNTGDLKTLAVTGASEGVKAKAAAAAKKLEMP